MANSTVQTTFVPTTTTYPFSVTTTWFSGTGTYKWPFQLPFTTPTASPTVIPFAVSRSCCSRWGSVPEDPIGLNASCSISVAQCDNPHAFWDLYTCCNGAEPQQFGGDHTYNMCSGTCQAVGQTWQELMNCLQKRTKVVVCKPDSEEIAVPISSSSPAVSSSTGTQGQSMSTGAVENHSATSVPAESSTGAAASADLVHIRGSKTGVAILFAILAFGSAAEMFL